MKNLDICLKGLIYDGAPTNDPADAVKLYSRVQESSILGVTRVEIQVANATSGQAVALPASTATYLVVSTDQPISINVNGSATATVLTPQAAGVKCLCYYQRGSITGLTVSNASGVVANVDIVLCNK